jgi:hypothetical protein
VLPSVCVARSRKGALFQQFGASTLPGWREFIFHDEVPKKYMGRVREYFGCFDVIVLDQAAWPPGGWAVPIPWSGAVDDLPSGYDGALVRAVQAREAISRPRR